jgi:hypothetical protein
MYARLCAILRISACPQSPIAAVGHGWRRSAGLRHLSYREG